MLDSAKLNDWLQVIGIFAVLGGLIFVGLQMKQDRQIALSESITLAADSRLNWAQLVIENTEVWAKGLSGDPLSPTESIQFEELAYALGTRHFASWYRNDQLGAIDAERFILEAANEIQMSPGLLAFWKKHDKRIRGYYNRISKPESRWYALVRAEIERMQADDSAESRN